jgi:hypothetical protein
MKRKMLPTPMALLTAVLLMALTACKSMQTQTTAGAAMEMTDTQVKHELLTRFKGTLLQPYFNWKNDGMWIKHNERPMAYAKKNIMTEQEWKMKDGKTSPFRFTSGQERIVYVKDGKEYTAGRIERNFDYWNIYAGDVLIGQVYFDGRMLDGNRKPCGRIEMPVTDDMAVFIYFAFAMQ